MEAWENEIYESTDCVACHDSMIFGNGTACQHHTEEKEEAE